MLTDFDTQMEELAAEEVACNCLPKYPGVITQTYDGGEYVGCSRCGGKTDGTRKGTGAVAVHEWARVTPCGHRQGTLSELTAVEWCAQHDESCPGYRPATLAEVRLEDVMLAEKLKIEPSPTLEDGLRWRATHWDTETKALGDTPTEAAVAAIYESRVKA